MFSKLKSVQCYTFLGQSLSLRSLLAVWTLVTCKDYLPCEVRTRNTSFKLHTQIRVLLKRLKRPISCEDLARFYLKGPALHHPISKSQHINGLQVTGYCRGPPSSGDKYQRYRTAANHWTCEQAPSSRIMQWMRDPQGALGFSEGLRNLERK